MITANDDMSPQAAAKRVVFIACGSFNPPTPMHLRMFEIAKDYFELLGGYKVIGGIVSPTHDSYKKKDLAPAVHRCSMVKLALKSSDWIRLSDWETNQNQWSRTKQVIQHHQNYLNNFMNCPTDDNLRPTWIPTGLRGRKDNVQLKLLCGADLLESFAVPGLWAEEDIEDILSNHGIVVISRSGSNPERFIFESDILTKHQKNITLVTNWVPNEVSSTMIRRLLRRQQSAKYLIDDLVLDYIKQNGLYGSKAKLVKHHRVHKTYRYSSHNLTNWKLLLEYNGRQPRVFCCGNDSSDKDKKSKTERNRRSPGQAVQVVTNSPGRRSTNEAEGTTKKLKMSPEYV